MNINHILLVAFQFPPKGGVGTRRWVKFVKYLSKRGYIVHVIACKYPFFDKQNWGSDIENNNNVRIYYVKSMYPTFLLNPNRTKFIKLCDRILSRTIFQLDKAQYWGRNYLKVANEIIKKNNVKNIIYTGAPFSNASDIQKIKSKFPNLNSIFDYRDYWLDYANFDLSNVTRYQKKLFTKDKKIVEKFDKIIFVTEDMRQKFIKYHPNHTSKYNTIYNGYDNEDYNDDCMDDTKFNIIYGGALENGRIQAIEMLAESIVELNDEFINNNLQINLFTDYNKSLLNNSKYKSAYDKHFNINGFVSPKEIIEKIKIHRYCLTINSPYQPDAFGTKVFDYMALNKRIVLISNESELYTLLKTNKYFVSQYTKEDFKSLLLDIKEDYYNNCSFVKSNTKFEINNLTNELERLFLI
jgi:glycosyltransferase involved in cell wall biosynthesis